MCNLYIFVTSTVHGYEEDFCKNELAFFIRDKRKADACSISLKRNPDREKRDRERYRQTKRHRQTDRDNDRERQRHVVGECVIDRDIK